jgi:hypothetical protein
VEIWRGRPYAIKRRRDVPLGIEDGFELAVFAKPTFAETLSKIPRKCFDSYGVGPNFAGAHKNDNAESNPARR